MKVINRFRVWLAHIVQIVSNKIQQDAAVATVRAELIAQDADHSRIVSGLWSEYETAVSDLRNELAQLRKSFDAEISRLNRDCDLLRASKRTAAGWVGPDRAA